MINKIILILIIACNCYSQETKINLVLLDFSRNSSNEAYELIFTDSTFNFDIILFTKINFKSYDQFILKSYEDYLLELIFHTKIVNVSYDSLSFIDSIFVNKSISINDYYRSIFKGNIFDTNRSLNQNIVLYQEYSKPNYKKSKYSFIRDSIMSNDFVQFGFMNNEPSKKEIINHFPDNDLLKFKIDQIRRFYTCQENNCNLYSDVCYLPRINYSFIRRYCVPRADYLSIILESSGFDIVSQKIILFGDMTKHQSSDSFTWFHHVANLVINVDKNGDTTKYVVDFATSDEVLAPETWKYKITNNICDFMHGVNMNCFYYCAIVGSDVALITPVAYINTRYHKCDVDGVCAKEPKCNCFKGNPKEGDYLMQFSYRSSLSKLKNDIKDANKCKIIESYR